MHMKTTLVKYTDISPRAFIDLINKHDILQNTGEEYVFWFDGWYVPDGDALDKHCDLVHSSMTDLFGDNYGNIDINYTKHTTLIRPKLVIKDRNIANALKMMKS